jgi:hypothetical protein
MTAGRTLKRVHVTSTVWFMLCVGYVFVAALAHKGYNWWLIFSLAGHSAVLILVLTSLYLFALFRGVRGTQRIAVEHPLTNSPYYMGFYVAAPLLGGLVGIVWMLWLGVNEVFTFLIGVAYQGTFKTTLAVWVILDPAAGLIEMILPASRKHRAERLAQAEAQRHARAERRERLLAEALARDEQERRRWQQRLQPEAERLAALLATDASRFEHAGKEALDIGATAWRLGGLTCMRQLRDMAMRISKDRYGAHRAVDYVSYWWDGIGDWRRPSLD